MIMPSRIYDLPTCVFVIYVLLFAVNASKIAVRKCERIQIKTCKGLGYEETAMPNKLGHEDQREAAMQLFSFKPLIQYGCSSQLKFFLCSVYVPMCNVQVHESIGPCRPICENVKKKCHPILNELGFNWPSILNCSRFPVENRANRMCMQGPEEKDTNSPQKIRPKTPHIPPSYEVPEDRKKQPTMKPKRKPAVVQCKNKRNPKAHIFINRTKKCALLCEQSESYYGPMDELWTKSDKSFAEIWLAVWASLCFFSTLFTMLTFLIDMEKFSYPQRPIIFMAISFNMHSVAYFVRLISGRGSASCDVDTHSGQQILIQGLESHTCTAIFMLTYYFVLSGVIWWVVAALTWYFCHGLHWKPESIQQHSTYFHVAAWVSPAMAMIVALIFRSVDADELFGMCFVGHQNSDALMGFLLAPMLTLVGLGLLFLLLGYSCHFCRQDAMVDRQAKLNAVQLRQPQIQGPVRKTGVLGLFCALPLITMIICCFYEYVNRDSPAIAVFMMKQATVLLIGCSTGIWIGSLPVAIDSWKKLFDRICCWSQQKKTVYHPAGTFLDERTQMQLQQQQRLQDPRAKYVMTTLNKGGRFQTSTVDDISV